MSKKNTTPAKNTAAPKAKAKKAPATSAPKKAAAPKLPRPDDLLASLHATDAMVEVDDMRSAFDQLRDVMITGLEAKVEKNKIDASPKLVAAAAHRVIRETIAPVFELSTKKANKLARQADKATNVTDLAMGRTAAAVISLTASGFHLLGYDDTTDTYEEQHTAMVDTAVRALVLAELTDSIGSKFTQAA